VERLVTSTRRQVFGGQSLDRHCSANAGLGLNKINPQFFIKRLGKKLGWMKSQILKEKYGCKNIT
jgi:hypothetical protein